MNQKYLNMYICIFQEDGASPRVKEESFEFIKKRAILLYDWPPNSPNLSPIEIVRRIMKNHSGLFEKLVSSKLRTKYRGGSCYIFSIYDIHCSPN